MSDEAFEREYQAMFALIGNAIGQWVHVEHGLFEILLEALTPSLPKLRDRVAAVFYANANFRVKLDMTDAALRTFLDEETYKQWAALFRRLKKKSKKRTTLAHSHVSLVGEQDPNQPKGHLRLVPKLKPEINKPANRMAYILGHEDLTAQDVVTYTQEFIQMQKDLAEFKKIVAQKALLPTSPAPEPDPTPSNTPGSQTGAAQP